MKKILVKRKDGGVTIIIPSDEATPELLERDALASKDYVSHREIEDHQIPSDRTFRNAWTDDNPTDTVDVDMNKATEIHKNRIRGLRIPLLEKLDIDFIKSVEAYFILNNLFTDDMLFIINKKKELRDVTIQLWPDKADDLKDFIPEVLK